MPDRTPDAVFVPAAQAETIGKTTLYNQLCTALGGRIRFGLDFHTNKKFGRLNENEHRLYPEGHPRQKEDRYDWFITRPVNGKWTAVLAVSGMPGEDDEVWLGYLKDDPHAENPETKTVIAAALEARIQDALLMAARDEAAKLANGGRSDA